MPDPQTIFQYGAGPVLLLMCVVAFWKGLPWFAGMFESNQKAFKEEMAASRAVFQEEIANERLAGQLAVKEERERSDRILSENNEVIERNTAALASLQQTVEKMMGSIGKNEE